MTNGQPKTQHCRDELILQHLPQVKLVALRIRERLPASIGLDDLISAGTVGLISAIDRYNEIRNVKLNTYAEFKIRGAILDMLRALDWLPRQRRRRVKKIEAAVTELERSLGRHPEGVEIAEYLGIAIEEYYQWTAEAGGVNLASLDSAVRDDDLRRQCRILEDRAGESPAQWMERTELEALLAAEINEMPQMDRTVLQLYFFENLTLREIASITGLHESRISQLKTRALMRLREALTRPPPMITPPAAMLRSA